MPMQAEGRGNSLHSYGARFIRRCRFWKRGISPLKNSPAPATTLPSRPKGHPPPFSDHNREKHPGCSSDVQGRQRKQKGSCPNFFSEVAIRYTPTPMSAPPTSPARKSNVLFGSGGLLWGGVPWGRGKVATEAVGKLYQEGPGERLVASGTIAAPNCAGSGF